MILLRQLSRTAVGLLAFGVPGLIPSPSGSGSTCIAKAQRALGDDSVEEIKKEVLKVQDQMNEAIEKGDVDALDRIYADHIAYCNGGGDTPDRAAILAEVRSGEFKPIKLDNDDIQLQVYGNTVVLTGRSNTILQYKGKISKGPRRFTNVFVKIDGRR
jgi:hypothetical protein